MSDVDFAHDAEVRRAAAMQRLGHGREFYTFLEQQVGSRAASEDIVRDAFALGNRDPLHEGESIRVWFYRLLRNAVLDQPRHAASLEGKLVTFREELEHKIEPSMAVQGAIDHHVRFIAESLSAEHSDLLRRVELGGDSLEGYALQAGISVSSAEERLSLARTELCRRVVSSFGTCSTHGSSNCTCGASLGDYGRSRPPGALR
jgi:DNA-directed RNA polymerase specialized sigma24 family protein